MKRLWDIFPKKTAVSLATLLLAGLCALPFKKVAVEISPRGIDATALKASLGKGVLFGVLGGYRSLVSDFVWIKSFLEWEKKDAAACVASTELAAAIDPYMTTFWRQGAGVMAYDIPHWKFAELPPEERTESELAALKKKGAKMAFAFIDKGLAIFPRNTELLLEKGQIAMDCADDYKVAEECYARALEVEKSDPPIYIRRTYAYILRKNGDLRGSLKMLESVEKDLEADSPLVPIVSKQIRGLKILIKKVEE